MDTTAALGAVIEEHVSQIARADIREVTSGANSVVNGPVRGTYRTQHSCLPDCAPDIVARLRAAGVILAALVPASLYQERD